MAKEKEKLTTLGPFTGLANVTINADQSSLYDMKNCRISDNGMAVVRRGGTLEVDSSDTIGYYDMFNMNISGVEMVIGVDYRRTELYAYLKEWPNNRFPLRSTSFINDFVNSLKASTNQLAFAAGTRFRLEETQDSYLIWSNSSGEFIVIRKQGVVKIGVTVDSAELYRDISFEWFTNLVRYGTALERSRASIYIDAEPFGFHDKPDIFFADLEGCVPIIPANSRLVEINQILGFGTSSDPKQLGARYKGGVFSPFDIVGKKEALSGNFTHEPHPYSEKLYVEMAANNAIGLTSISESYNPVLLPDIDVQMVWVMKYANYSSAMPPVQPDIFHEQYMWVLETVGYWDTATVPSTWVPLGSNKAWSNVDRNRYPVRISLDAPTESGGVFQDKMLNAELGYWVVVDEKIGVEEVQYLAEIPVTGYVVLARWGVYRVSNHDNVPFPRHLETNVDLYMNVLAQLDGSTHNQVKDPLFTYPESFMGVALSGTVSLHDEDPELRTPEARLMITNNPILKNSLVDVTEHRFHHDITHYPFGILGTTMLAGARLDFYGSGVRLNAAAPIDETESNPKFLIANKNDEVTDFMERGYRIALVDGGMDRLMAAKRGFSYLDTSSNFHYDISELPAGEASLPERMGPLGKLTNYYAPFVSTRYLSLASKNTLDMQTTDLPITLRGARDVCVVNNYIYAAFDGYILRGSTATLTLRDSIELNRTPIMLAALSDGVVVFNKDGCTYIGDNEGKLQVRSVINGDRVDILRAYSTGTSILVVNRTGVIFIISIRYTDSGTPYYVATDTSVGLIDRAELTDVVSITFLDSIYYIATRDKIFLFDERRSRVTGVYNAKKGREIYSVSHLAGELVVNDLPKDVLLADLFFPDGGG